MSWALLCAAAAVIVCPPSGARRRFAGRSVVGRGRIRVPRIVVPAALAAVAVLLAFLGTPWLIVGGGAAAFTVRHRMRAARRDREHTAARASLLDGLDIVVAELTAGAHPSSACAAAAHECTGFASGVFGIAAARSRLGGSAAEAIASVAHDNPEIAGELGRLADAWTLAERNGLALAELLAAARSDLNGRIRFRGRTEAGLAGARATALVLAGLPILGILLGQAMGAAPLRVLLSGGAGGVLLALGVCFVCAGVLWTDRITTRAVP